jgi:hypothetical protein
MEELFIPAGHHTRHNYFVHDKKKLRNSDFQANRMPRKRRERHAFLSMQREEALHEAEGVSFEAAGF